MLLKKNYEGNYALCDYETLNKKKLNLDDFLSLISSFDIKLLQYRDKISSLKTQIQNLKYLKSKTNIPIIVNDNPSLLDFADGLHLGQEDLLRLCKSDKMQAKKHFLQELKRQNPNKILGLSTHKKSEILEANEFCLSYIGLGAYRASKTKQVEYILGAKAFSLAKLSKHKVALIGGLRLEDKLENITYKVMSSAFYV